VDRVVGTAGAAGPRQRRDTERRRAEHLPSSWLRTRVCRTHEVRTTTPGTAAWSRENGSRHPVVRRFRTGGVNTPTEEST
jgi:hypothetical protein